MFTVAAIQLTAGTDKSLNLEKATRLVVEAAERGAQLVVLPELFSFWGNLRAIADVAEPIPGPTTERLATLARHHGIHLVCGSLAERGPGKPYNTTVLLGPDGSILGGYRKIHLMSNRVPGTRAYDEGDFIAAGESTQLAVVATPLAPVGLALCYDLRFPELFIALALGGARVIAVPSALSAATGQAHWHVLLRARAIETQSFVIAANQVGATGSAAPCFGHSIVVGPWGEVVAELPAGEGVLTAELDLVSIDRVRGALPSLDQRRATHYPLTG